MNTVRHPAAPTEADVALSNTIRTVCGRAICAGEWPRDTLLAAMRLTEDVDDAEAKGDTPKQVRKARELLALAPADLAEHIQPGLPRAA